MLKEVLAIKPVVAALYWTATIVFAVCVFAVTQAIGVLWDDQDESSFPANILALPSYALNTHAEYYVPSPEVSPTGWLSDEGFLRYTTLVLWAIVCFTGLGLELVLGEPMVKALMAKGDGSNAMQLWKAAQLFFSLAISVALFSQSPFGLPWAVVGFWKCGFPETMGCFRRGLRLGTASDPKFTSAVAAWLDGMGALIHHCSGAYLIVAVATHLCQLDRRVLALALPLVGQHMFSLLKYWNVPLYCIVELTLEIFFEWEVFANLADFSKENGYDSSLRGAALSMTFAHWCYWISALFGVPEMLNNKSTSASMEALAKDSSGMDYEEFQAVMKKKNVPVAMPQLKMLFDEADEDKSGVIDSDEAKKLIKQMRILFPDMDKEEKTAEGVFEVTVEK